MMIRIVCQEWFRIVCRETSLSEHACYCFFTLPQLDTKNGPLATRLSSLSLDIQSLSSATAQSCSKLLPSPTKSLRYSSVHPIINTPLLHPYN